MVRKIFCVASAGTDFGHCATVASPEHDVMVVACQDAGKGRSEGAGTDDSGRVHALAIRFPEPSIGGASGSSGHRGRASRSSPSR